MYHRPFDRPMGLWIINEFLNYYAYNALNLQTFYFIYIVDLICLDRTLGLTTVRLTGKGYRVLKCYVTNIYYGID